MHQEITWSPSNFFFIDTHGMKQEAKMGNMKGVYNGHKYDSKFEAQRAMYYDILKKSGHIKEYEPHVRLRLEVNRKLVCHYKIDFVVTHNDGAKEYVEVKGFQTQAWRQKWKLFEAIMQEEEPGATLTIVKQAKAFYRKKNNRFINRKFASGIY
jgi:hypothetical protein